MTLRQALPGVTLGLAILAAENEAVASLEAAAARRGIDYLLAAQGEDGWWRVASDRTSKSCEESKDYVYDDRGTAWATIGLSRWHAAIPDSPG